MLGYFNEVEKHFSDTWVTHENEPEFITRSAYRAQAAHRVRLSVMTPTIEESVSVPRQRRFLALSMAHQSDADAKKTENAFTSIARTGVGWPSTFRWHHGRLTTSLQIAAHLVLDVSMTWPARNSCHHLHAGPARAAAYCPHTVSPNQPRPWLSHTQIARRLLCRRTAGARTWSNFYSVSCSLSGFGQVSRRSRTRRRFQQFNHASTFATARCRRFHRRFKFNGIRLHGSK